MIMTRAPRTALSRDGTPRADIVCDIVVRDLLLDRLHGRLLGADRLGGLVSRLLL